MTGLKTEGSRNPEIESARSMYTWLKISPIFTVPTILFLFQRDLGYDLICGTDWITNFSNCNTDMADFVSIALAIMLPALWHVLLLIQVRNQKREFARWHGWQALMLAGIRTAISLVFVLVDGWTRMNDAMNGTWRSGFGSYPLAVILLMIAYFAGNSWGQKQAREGDCWLMRKAGHRRGLLLQTHIETKPIETKPTTEVDTIYQLEDSDGQSD
jgi:hypothetical protein